MLAVVGEAEALEAALAPVGDQPDAWLGLRLGLRLGLGIGLGLGLGLGLGWHHRLDELSRLAGAGGSGDLHADSLPGDGARW